MSKTARLALIGFVVLLIAVVVLAFLFRKPSTFPEVPTTGSNSLPVVPVNPSGKNVTWAFAEYNFFASIREIKPVSSGLELTLYTPQNNNVPKFIVTPLTRIYKSAKVNNKTQYAQAAATDLKTGIKVAVIATYDLQKYTWTTRQIYIPVKTLPAITPTPKPVSTSVPQTSAAPAR